MDTANVLKFAAFTLFLVFHPQIDGPLVATVPIPPFAPRPLCNFQLALANQACAYLPSSLVPPPPPPPPPFATGYPTPPPSSEHHDQSHRHRHRHHHSHANEHDDGHGLNETHGHGHHRHGHGHRKHRMSPIEQQCCKWLAQVDDECVCELLGRLPPFLARPVHEYTVRVAGSCNTTYSCGAGLLRL
ncbi:hypothetical protein L6452_04290 [Arctium lappa]|uniref:Uncharacterized protein n=1 Tax=Arctium lappa TaxID=4217 RepID=A0ACB9FQ27_ARCLA|nr:hypothetical protein L6452_04290 [Arctium lappa]